MLGDWGITQDGANACMKIYFIIIQSCICSEFGRYYTRFRFINDSIMCQIVQRNHEVAAIQVTGDDNQVMTFSSPGFLTSHK